MIGVSVTDLAGQLVQPGPPCSTNEDSRQQVACSTSVPIQYMWLGGRPTCSKCGDRGHDVGSCTTQFCNTCCKYGHGDGDCSSACSTCGKNHTSKTCILCKRCGLFGHLLTMCPSTQCDRCWAMGHISRDCFVELPEAPAAPNSNTAATIEQDLQARDSAYMHGSSTAAGGHLSTPSHQQYPYHMQPVQQTFGQHSHHQHPQQQQQSHHYYQQLTTESPHTALHYQSGSYHVSSSLQEASSQQQHHPGSLPLGHVQDSSHICSKAEGDAHHLWALTEADGQLIRSASRLANSSSPDQMHAGSWPHAAEHFGHAGQGSQSVAGEQHPHSCQPLSGQSSTGDTLTAPQQHDKQQPAVPAAHQHLQQVTHDQYTSRCFVWPARIPTCYRCGDRGHEAPSCATAFCEVCGKFGHATGLCDRQCSQCGKQHTGKGCKQCKLCGKFGHVSTVCPDALCSICSCWGHTPKDCATVCNCGYHIPHSPAKCPGLCTKCLKYGHFTSACTAAHCQRCSQWGAGCTSTHCFRVQPGGTAAQQNPTTCPVPAVPPPTHTAASLPADSTDASSAPPPKLAAASSTSRAPSADLHARTIGSTAADCHSSNADRVFANTRVVISGASVQLEHLTDEEDEVRRQRFVSMLISHPRSEFNAYATRLLDEPHKLSVLIRVPKDLMKSQVLKSPDAVQLLEAICTQYFGSRKASQRTASASGSSVRTAGQQLLPEYADELQRSLPDGLLPPDWRDLSFRDVEDRLRWEHLFVNPIPAKALWRAARREAKTKTAMATGAEDHAAVMQEGADVSQPPALQRPPSQQAHARGHAHHDGRTSRAQQQSLEPSSSADRVPGVGSRSRQAHSRSSRDDHHGQRHSTTQDSCSTRRAAAEGTLPAASPLLPPAAADGDHPRAYSSQGQADMQPCQGTRDPWKPEAVQLEVPPAPDVASQRKQRLADVLLSHENGDLHEFALQVVEDDAKLSLLTRVPWADLQWCFSQHNAVELLDQLYAVHGPGNGCRFTTHPALEKEQQQQVMVQQVVQEDHSEGSDVDGHAVHSPSLHQQQQQRQQHNATDTALTLVLQTQPSEAGAADWSQVKLRDLFPEYLDELEARFKLKPGWRDAASWREIDKYFVNSHIRSSYRKRRQELQALTAARLAAAGSAARTDSSVPSSGAAGESAAGSAARRGAAEQTGPVVDAPPDAQGRSPHLLDLKLRVMGTQEEEAAVVAQTTSLLLSHQPEYMRGLLHSLDAGAKMAFLARLQPEDLLRVLQQQEAPPGEVLDDLYGKYLATQGGKKAVGVGEGPTGSRLALSSLRCAQS